MKIPGGDGTNNRMLRFSISLLVLAVLWSMSLESCRKIGIKSYDMLGTISANIMESLRKNILPGDKTGKNKYAETGDGHRLEAKKDKGTYLSLEDGSLWEVEYIDRVEAALWPDGSAISVTEANTDLEGYDYILVRSDNGEAVRAKRVEATE